MKYILLSLSLLCFLACEGQPTVKSNQTPGAGNDELGRETSAALDAGAEENFNFNEAWSSLISDGGPLEGLYVDGGVLSCLPEEWPEADNPVSAVLDFASLRIYSGEAEEGVVCDGTLCAPGIPCCVFCGVGFCGEPGENGGMGSCPFTTRTIGCDDNSDCTPELGGDTCCMNLSGTECRPADNCSFSFEFGGEGDGGISFGGFSAQAGDAGGLPQPDGGTPSVVSPSLDGGVPPAPATDAGASVPASNPDAGLIVSPADLDGGAAGDVLDGGMTLEEEVGFWDTQGFPICTRSFDCDLFEGEVCCTSERFTAVDLGVCLPIWLCLGNTLIDGFGGEDEDD